MRRIFLDEIGDTSRWDNRFKDKGLNLFNHRSWYPMKQVRRRGFADAETWNLDSTALEFLYERLRGYILEKNAGGTIDLETEFHIIEYHGQQYNLLQFIRGMIEIAEYILCDIDNIKVYGWHKKKKKEEVKNRLLNNFYYKQYGVWFIDIVSYENYTPELEHSFEKTFWEMWSKVYPYIWW